MLDKYCTPSAVSSFKEQNLTWFAPNLKCCSAKTPSAFLAAEKIKLTVSDRERRRRRGRKQVKENLAGDIISLEITAKPLSNCATH